MGKSWGIPQMFVFGKFLEILMVSDKQFTRLLEFFKPDKYLSRNYPYLGALVWPGVVSTVDGPSPSPRVHMDSSSSTLGGDGVCHWAIGDMPRDGGARSGGLFDSNGSLALYTTIKKRKILNFGKLQTLVYFTVWKKIYEKLHIVWYKLFIDLFYNVLGN